MSSRLEELSQAAARASSSRDNPPRRNRSRSRSNSPKRQQSRREDSYDRRDNRRDDRRDDRRNSDKRDSNFKQSHDSRAKRRGDSGWSSRPRSASPGRPSKSLALPSQQSLSAAESGAPPPIEVIEPNYKASGLLAAETNTFQGVVLKYNEPPEARKPVKLWRLYAFKGKEQVDLFLVHKQSAYLLGRDRVVVDIPLDHPSTSKQHAVLQFRQTIEKNTFGDVKSSTKPYIIDLDSANGTTVNDEAIPTQRYYELQSGDVLKFAFSTRDSSRAPTIVSHCHSGPVFAAADGQSAWYGLISNIIVILFSGFSTFLYGQFSVAKLLTTYLPTVLFPISYFGYKFWFETKTVSYSDMDLITGSSSPEDEEDEEVPVGFGEKIWRAIV